MVVMRVSRARPGFELVASLLRHQRRVNRESREHVLADKRAMVAACGTARFA